MDEKKTVKSLKKGDVNALSHIIKSYTPYVLKIISNVGRDNFTVEDKEEIAQDTFLTLFQNRVKIKDDCLKPYIGSIARSKAKDNLRTKKGVTVDIDDIVIIDDTAVSAELENAEQGEILTKALSQLDEKTQKTIILYYYWYYTVSEISAQLDMPEGTVKTQLHRGREKLRLLLGGKENEANII